MSTPADLRVAVTRITADWQAFHNDVMAGGLFGVEPATVDQVYRMGRYTLHRFLPRFDPHGENHIGEMITDGDGRLAYLKTFRLSAAQARRGHLLTSLAAHDWHLDNTATALRTTREDLVARMERSGFGALLRQHVRDAARAYRRRLLSQRGG